MHILSPYSAGRGKALGLRGGFVMLDRPLADGGDHQADLDHRQCAIERGKAEDRCPHLRHGQRRGPRKVGSTPSTAHG
jgi:hypothetical protein